jgi:hypothetical protein
MLTSTKEAALGDCRAEWTTRVEVEPNLPWRRAGRKACRTPEFLGFNQWQTPNLGILRAEPMKRRLADHSQLAVPLSILSYHLRSDDRQES